MSHEEEAFEKEKYFDNKKGGESTNSKYFTSQKRDDYACTDKLGLEQASSVPNLSSKYLTNPKRRIANKNDKS